MKMGHRIIKRIVTFGIALILGLLGSGTLAACSNGTTSQEINDDINPLAGPDADSDNEDSDNENIAFNDNENQNIASDDENENMDNSVEQSMNNNVNQNTTTDTDNSNISADNENINVNSADEENVIEEKQVKIDTVEAITDEGEPIVDTPTAGIGDAEEVIIQ